MTRFCSFFILSKLLVLLSIFVLLQKIDRKSCNRIVFEQTDDGQALIRIAHKCNYLMTQFAIIKEYSKISWKNLMRKLSKPYFVILEALWPIYYHKIVCPFITRIIISLSQTYIFIYCVLNGLANTLILIMLNSVHL